jgi:hypothetical protein
MKRRILPLAILVACILALTLAGCSDSPAEVGPVTIDLSVDRTAESIQVSVIRQGETHTFAFEGISLDAILAAHGIAAFSKIELVASDFTENMDITEWANAEAGVFIAWRESGNPENPARVFPKDAATGNLLIRNVTKLLVYS